MKLGKLGVWNAMDSMSAADGAAFANRVEAWGYSALWLLEGRGPNSGCVLQTSGLTCLLGALNPCPLLCAAGPYARELLPRGLARLGWGGPLTWWPFTSD